MTIEARVLFVLTNNADLGAVTCADEVSTLPAAYLQEPKLGLPMRTLGTNPSNTKILLDQGSSKKVEAVALVKHNLQAAGTVDVIVSDNADLSSPIYTGSALPTLADDTFDRNMFVHLIGAAPVGRYVGVNLSDASNPAGYLQAARLVVGPVSQLTRHFVWGMQVQVIDPSEITIGPMGHKHRRRVRSRRQVMFTLQNLGKSETFATLLRALDLDLGVTGDFLTIAEPTDTTYWNTLNIWGSQVEIDANTWPDVTGWDRSIVIEERVG